jgi:disulfide oxidoreductase YuzD
MCFASQIRVNPNTKNVYSTVENKIHDDIIRIWIRDATNTDDIFTFKYIDITEANHRVIKERYIGKVNSSGHFVEVKDAHY